MVPAMILLTITSGCGYRRLPLTQPQAVVTLDGDPLAEAVVMLVPIKSGRAVKGFTDVTGRVIFSTYGSGDGVPLGSYRAVVTKLVPTKQAGRRMAAARQRSAASAEEGVDAEVTMQEDDFRNLLPARYASFGTTDLTVTIDRGTREFTLALVSADASR